MDVVTDVPLPTASGMLERLYFASAEKAEDPGDLAAA